MSNTSDMYDWQWNCETDHVSGELLWQITFDITEPATAREDEKFGDYVVVSAVAVQWIVID